MVKRAERKVKLESALKEEISKIKNGYIKGVINDFKVNSVTIFNIVILSPTDDFDEDDFKNAKEIDFEADVEITIMGKRVSTYNCKGTAKTEYVNKDFIIVLESYRFSSLKR